MADFRFPASGRFEKMYCLNSHSVLPYYGSPRKITFLRGRVLLERYLLPAVESWFACCLGSGIPLLPTYFTTSFFPSTENIFRISRDGPPIGPVCWCLASELNSAANKPANGAWSAALYPSTWFLGQTVSHRKSTFRTGRIHVLYVCFRWNCLTLEWRKFTPQRSVSNALESHPSVLKYRQGGGSACPEPACLQQPPNHLRDKARLCLLSCLIYWHIKTTNHN